jgi:hypothetical protein
MTTPRHDAARTLAVRLSWALTALMTVQAGVGLVWPSLYRDPAWIVSAWFGCDVVTLVGGVPLIVGGLLAMRRGSLRGELLWLAGLGYAIYNYAYFALGAHLNPVFPIYITLTVGAAWTLILALVSADIPAIAAAFGPKTPARSVAAYMLFTGVGLAIAWLAQWGAYVFAGTVPSIGEAPFRLVAAMDLVFMVPAMLIGAHLLWRRRAWGYVIAAIAVTQGATYTAGLTVASVAGGLRGVAGAMAQAPVWGAWTLAGAAATVALLWCVALPLRSTGMSAPE